MKIIIKSERNATRFFPLKTELDKMTDFFKKYADDNFLENWYDYLLDGMSYGSLAIVEIFSTNNPIVKIPSKTDEEILVEFVDLSVFKLATETTMSDYSEEEANLHLTKVNEVLEDLIDKYGQLKIKTSSLKNGVVDEEQVHSIDSDRLLHLLELFDFKNGADVYVKGNEYVVFLYGVGSYGVKMEIKGEKND